ncbi:MAG: DUF5652 family protein [Candidatus Bathyarchaeia archaeon]
MLPINISLLLILLVPVAIWSYFWKIIGLWFSARNGEKAWFIVFVFVNLVGILELYYLHSRKCWPFKRKQ